MWKATVFIVFEGLEYVLDNVKKFIVNFCKNEERMMSIYLLQIYKGCSVVANVKKFIVNFCKNEERMMSIYLLQIYKGCSVVANLYDMH